MEENTSKMRELMSNHRSSEENSKISKIPKTENVAFQENDISVWRKLTKKQLSGNCTKIFYYHVNK